MVRVAMVDACYRLWEKLSKLTAEDWTCSAYLLVLIAPVRASCLGWLVLAIVRSRFAPDDVGLPEAGATHCY
jgi:hypothetical protein